MFPFCHPVDPAYTGPHSEKHTSYVDKATTAPILTREVLMVSHSIPSRLCCSIFVLVESSLTISQNFIRPENPLGLAADPTNVRHFPLLASTLSNFPRTYIATAEHDPCRDDGRVLALRLKEESTSGVKEDYYEGLPHYFHWFPSLKITGEFMEKAVAGTQWVISDKA